MTRNRQLRFHNCNVAHFALASQNLGGRLHYPTANKTAPLIVHG